MGDIESVIVKMLCLLETLKQNKISGLCLPYKNSVIYPNSKGTKRNPVKSGVSVENASLLRYQATCLWGSLQPAICLI